MPTPSATPTPTAALTLAFESRKQTFKGVEYTAGERAQLFYLKDTAGQSGRAFGTGAALGDLIDGKPSITSVDGTNSASTTHFVVIVLERARGTVVVQSFVDTFAEFTVGYTLATSNPSPVPTPTLTPTPSD